MMNSTASSKPFTWPRFQPRQPDHRVIPCPASFQNQSCSRNSFKPGILRGKSEVPSGEGTGPSPSPGLLRAWPLALWRAQREGSPLGNRSQGRASSHRRLHPDPARGRLGDQEQVRTEGREAECGLQLHVLPARVGRTPRAGVAPGSRGPGEGVQSPSLGWREKRAKTSPQSLRPPGPPPTLQRPAAPPDSAPSDPCPLPSPPAIPRTPRILTRAAPAARTARRARHRAAQPAGAAAAAKAPSPELLQPPPPLQPLPPQQLRQLSHPPPTRNPAGPAPFLLSRGPFAR